MKILWASNAPWCGTGYGQQTALVTARLHRDGHDVAIATNYGLQGAKTGWEGMDVLPGGYDQFSNDIIPAHAEQHLGGEPGDGWLITLFDVWVFKNPRFQHFNTASWVPVDHRPAPPAVVEFLEGSRTVPIAMSMFGVEQLQAAGLDPLYAPHGVETDVFTPLDQTAAREMFGMPADAFVVMMNSANKDRGDRKSFFESFAATAQLMRLHDDVMLFVHAEAHGAGGGLDLGELAAAVGIPSDRLRFIDQYLYRMSLQPKVLAHMYSASDVLLAPSKGEGFGIPVIEAQACGIPVIVSNFSAQPELLGSGWLVEGEPIWDPGHKATFFRPRIGSIIEGLQHAYEHGGGGPDLNARAHALGYDADVVHRQYWQPIMAELEQRSGTIAPLHAEPLVLA